MTSPPRNAGYTLVELLVVLAIMGLVVGVFLPLLKPAAPRAVLAAAAAELRSALTGARALAIAEDRPVRVSGIAGGYRVDGAPHLFAAPAGLQVESGGAVAFFPTGGSSGGRIVLRAANLSREIDVEALTGRARLAP